VTPAEYLLPGATAGRKSLPTGVALHYLQKGESDKIPTIFMHGFIDSWLSFREVLAALPQEFHAVAPDLRGHGDSDKPVCCYTIKDFTEDLLALEDALGFKKANFVGHSLGSFIAQSVALHSPERVHRLILISSAPAATNNAVLKELTPIIEALPDPVSRDFVVDFQTLANPIAKLFFEMLVAESLKVPVYVWKAAWAGLLEVDNTAVLQNITAPTLLMWGNQDQLFRREEQDGLLSKIPGSVLKEYEAGHAPHWEKPQELAIDLVQFLID
jgi:non-heme chloroperoxidase